MIDLITDASNVLKESGGGAELFPKVLDMDVDRPVEDDFIVSPESIEDLISGENTAGL